MNDEQRETGHKLQIGDATGHIVVDIGELTPSQFAPPPPPNLTVVGADGLPLVVVDVKAGTIYVRDKDRIDEAAHLFVDAVRRLLGEVVGSE